jgi:hypothetical protein
MEEKSIEKGAIKIKFAYIKPEKYDVYYINGAYGGFTPRGELLCNFFFEYVQLPREEVATVKDNRLSAIETDVPKNEVQRELRVGLVMMPQEAKNLADWIYTKLNEFEEQSK